MLRAVLDANVLVSAHLRPEGTCGQVVVHAVTGRSVRSVVSPAIVEEYRRSLRYPKVRRHHGLSDKEIDTWLGGFVLLSDVVPGELEMTVVHADPEDDKYVAAAVEGRASHVVTGDRHLLDLDPWEGVRLVSPREFLDTLEEE